MGKEMEKGKRKGISLLTVPGGNFGPAEARARARARAGGLASPRKGGTARVNAVGAGPHVRGRRRG